MDQLELSFSVNGTNYCIDWLINHCNCLGICLYETIETTKYELSKVAINLYIQDTLLDSMLLIEFLP